MVNGPDAAAIRIGVYLHAMTVRSTAQAFAIVAFAVPGLLLAQGGTDTIAAPHGSHGTGLKGEPVAPASLVLTVAEVMPEFPGGWQALMKYMASHLQYPEIAKDEGIQGKVFLRFVVQEDGSLRDVEVIRGVHPSLDHEALRVAKAMPNWIAGKNMGKMCCVQYRLPVNFVLD